MSVDTRSSTGPLSTDTSVDTRSCSSRLSIDISVDTLSSIDRVYASADNVPLRRQSAEALIWRHHVFVKLIRVVLKFYEIAF